MTQGDLFDGDDVNGSDEQRENIARVHHKIAPTILQFFRSGGYGHEFHVDELRRYVKASWPEIAPDSPGRIMRDMRGRGLIDYEVVNRRASLYRVTTLEQSPGNPS